MHSHFTDYSKNEVLEVWNFRTFIMLKVLLSRTQVPQAYRVATCCKKILSFLTSYRNVKHRCSKFSKSEQALRWNSVPIINLLLKSTRVLLPLGPGLLLFISLNKIRNRMTQNKISFNFKNCIYIRFELWNYMTSLVIVLAKNKF